MLIAFWKPIETQFFQDLFLRETGQKWRYKKKVKWLSIRTKPKPNYCLMKRFFFWSFVDIDYSGWWNKPKMFKKGKGHRSHMASIWTLCCQTNNHDLVGLVLWLAQLSCMQKSGKPSSDKKIPIKKWMAASPSWWLKQAHHLVNPWCTIYPANNNLSVERTNLLVHSVTWPAQELLAPKQISILVPQ